MKRIKIIDDISEDMLVFLFEKLNRRFITNNIFDAIDLKDLIEKKINSSRLISQINIYNQILEILNRYQTQRYKHPIYFNDITNQELNSMQLINYIIMSNPCSLDKLLIAYTYKYIDPQKALINNTEDLISLYRYFTKLMEDQDIKIIRNSIFEYQETKKYLKP